MKSSSMSVGWHLLLICIFLACKKESVQPSTTILTQASAATVSPFSTTILPVSGTIQEAPIAVGINRSNIWTGTLQGTGNVVLISADVIDENNSINIVSKRRLDSPSGTLFLDEIGEHHNSVVNVTSTVKGGTGMFKGASGVLYLSGTHGELGVPLFNYTGEIILLN